MKRDIQKRFAPKQLTFALKVALLVSFAPTLWAQPRGGFGGGPDFDGRPDFGPKPGFGRRGGFDDPSGPGGRGSFGGRRNSPKFQLTRWMEGVQRLDAAPQTALSKAQAKQVLASVSPWRKKKTMTDKEATTLHTGLMAVLTSAQQSKLATNGRFGSAGGPLSGGNPFGGSPNGGPDGNPNGFGSPPDGFGGGPGGRDRDGQGPGRRDSGGPRRDDFGPPPGGFGGGDFDGEELSSSQMKVRRDTMQAFMQSNNPLASPKSNPQFSKLPEEMRQGAVERFKMQSDFLNWLKKKAK